MKREYVIPDLLARLTADALFSGSPRRNATAPAAASPPSALERIGHWFRRAPEAVADSSQPSAARVTLTDDWSGGWYARTRLLQATTLAQHAANSGATTSRNAGLDASAVDAKAAS